MKDTISAMSSGVDPIHQGAVDEAKTTHDAKRQRSSVKQAVITTVMRLWRKDKASGSLQ